MTFAALVFVLFDGRIFAVRSSEGRWGFPGGKLESGEDAATAAIRELGEETGLYVRHEEIVAMFSGLVEGRVVDTFYLAPPQLGSVHGYQRHDPDHGFTATNAVALVPMEILVAPQTGRHHGYNAAVFAHLSEVQKHPKMVAPVSFQRRI